MSGNRGNNNRPPGGSMPPRGGGPGGSPPGPGGGPGSGPRPHGSTTGPNTGSGLHAPMATSGPTGSSADTGRGRLEDLLRQPREPINYFSANDPKAVEVRLLGDEAESVAKRLADVPASQLRRFYAEVMALKRRADLASASDDEIRAQLTLLRAKAAYTWGRQTRYPGELVAFFTRHAYSVRTRHDFLRGFQPHFEAVMAFHKVFENKRGGEA